MIWFTSDLHFDHANVIEYCNRPFKDVDEMNEQMINRWNAKVAHTDIIYVLGDFSLSTQSMERHVHKLNGTKRLIMGNHDGCFSRESHKRRYFAAGWESIETAMQIQVWGKPFMLSHFPYGNLDGRYGEYHPKDEGLPLLHGHVHEKYITSGRQFNVGVDVHEFEPVSEVCIAGWLSKGFGG